VDRFTLEWSTVELDRSEYWVCEDAGRLDVVVRRRGTNATRVTANIRAKPLSARAGLDFISNSEGLLIFAPGPFGDTYDTIRCDTIRYDTKYSACAEKVTGN